MSKSAIIALVLTVLSTTGSEWVGVDDTDDAHTGLTRTSLGKMQKARGLKCVRCCVTIRSNRHFLRKKTIIS